MSAFLKLRALAPGRAGVPARVRRAGPAGRALVVHRLRPREVLRWSLADGGDPYALAAERVGRFEPGADGRRRRRSPAAPSASSATTSCAPSSRSASPAPDPLGLPDMALMLTDALVVFDHLKHTVTILANADLDAEPDLERAYAEAARDDRARSASALAGPVPRGASRARRARARCRSSSRTCRASASKRWSARIVEYIYAGDAFQVVPSQRWSAPVAGRGVLDLPRPARGQPEPLHVLPGLRRLPGRRREPRAAADGQRPRRQHASRSPAPGRAGRRPRRTGGSPPSCSPTRRSAPST